jgi:hypothetical protein
VNSTTVIDAVHATANLTIAAGAPGGVRTVTMTTGGEVIVVDKRVHGVVRGAGADAGVAGAGVRRRWRLCSSLVHPAARLHCTWRKTCSPQFRGAITVTSTTVQARRRRR